MKTGIKKLEIKSIYQSQNIFKIY